MLKVVKKLSIRISYTFLLNSNYFFIRYAQFCFATYSNTIVYIVLLYFFTYPNDYAKLAIRNCGDKKIAHTKIMCVL